LRKRRKRMERRRRRMRRRKEEKPNIKLDKLMGFYANWMNEKRKIHFWTIILLILAEIK
jgi:hypothetical protein